MLEPRVTSPWPCSMFVCPRGAHRSLLWCTICIQVVGWGGRVTFVHQRYVGIIVAPWDDDVLGQTFLSQESTCLSYKHFAQCLPGARLLSQVHPKGSMGGAPAESYNGCPQASRPFLKARKTRREGSSLTAETPGENHCHVNENIKSHRRFSSRTDSHRTQKQINPVNVVLRLSSLTIHLWF